MSMPDDCYDLACGSCTHESVPADMAPCNLCCNPVDGDGSCRWEPKKAAPDTYAAVHPPLTTIPVTPHIMGVDPKYLLPEKKASDGSTADYYVLPKDATQLQDLIAFRNMNAQMGEIGRAWYRYGQCPHSPKIRELKKIIFYAEAEIDRLEKYEKQ